MNKVNIGPPALSMYHQALGFMPINDSIRLPDHDFSSAKGCKLDVSGFMKLDYFSQRPGLRSNSINTADQASTLTRQNSAPFPDRLHPSTTINPIEICHLKLTNLDVTISIKKRLAKSFHS